MTTSKTSTARTIHLPFDPSEEVLDELMLRASASRESVLRRIVGLPVRGRAGGRVDDAVRTWATRRPFAWRPPSGQLRTFRGADGSEWMGPRT